MAYVGRNITDAHMGLYRDGWRLSWSSMNGGVIFNAYARGGERVVLLVDRWTKDVREAVA